MLDDFYFFFVLKPSAFFFFLCVCLKAAFPVVHTEDNGEIVVTIELFGLDGGTNHNNVQMKASGSARCVWEPKLWRSDCWRTSGLNLAVAEAKQTPGLWVYFSAHNLKVLILNFHLIGISCLKKKTWPLFQDSTQFWHLSLSLAFFLSFCLIS